MCVICDEKTESNELEVQDCKMITEIPHLSHITSLIIIKCPNLVSIPSLPTLEHLGIGDCPKMTSIPSFPNLRRLMIPKSSIKTLPRLESLDTLSITSCAFSEKDIADFNLQRLDCRWCPNIKTIPIFPALTRLNCSACVNLENIENQPELLDLFCNQCSRLKEIPVAPLLTNLECDEVNVSEMPIYTHLTYLHARASKLVEIPSLHLLETLHCNGCPNLERIGSDMPFLTSLVCRNTNINEIPSFPSLGYLNCSWCPNLKKIGRMPELLELRCASSRLLLSMPESNRGYIKMIKGCPWLNVSKDDLNSLCLLQKCFRKYQARKRVRICKSNIFPRVLLNIVCEYI